MFDVLPTELVEQIGLTLLSVAAVDVPYKNKVDVAVQRVRALHPLALVNARFNAIFTPHLYRQLILQTVNSRASFLDYTAKNREICKLVNILIYSERMNGSLFHNIASKSSDLDTVLLALPHITTLKISKVVYWKKWMTYESSDYIDLTSLTHLRTLELLEPRSVQGLNISLHSILPQIERLVVSGLELRPYESGARDLYAGLINLKSIRIHSTRFTFEMWTGAILSMIGSDKLEEIDLDSTIPFTMYLGPYPFMKVGAIDRWKETLRVFRFVGDPLETELRKYLHVALQECEAVDITEIPVQHGEGHSLKLWMG